MKSDTAAVLPLQGSGSKPINSTEREIMFKIPVTAATLFFIVPVVSVFGQPFTVNLPRSLADSEVTMLPVKTHLLYREGPAVDKNGNLFFSNRALPQNRVRSSGKLRLLVRRPSGEPASIRRTETISIPTATCCAVKIPGWWRSIHQAQLSKSSYPAHYMEN